MLLEQSCFFIREHIALMKLTNTYDILNPGSGASIGIAREEPPEWAKLARLVVGKGLLPTTINVYETEGMPPVLSIHRPVTLLQAALTVTGANGEPYGSFKGKLFALGGGFWVYDRIGTQIAEVRGEWRGWNFQFVALDGRELGRVTKEWAGVGRELFTSADNYMVSLNEYGSANPQTAGLLLAAALSIDIVYKEKD